VTNYARSPATGRYLASTLETRCSMAPDPGWFAFPPSARQFWHARLTPFTRSHKSRATRSRLPYLPRPALRGWRPGAGQTPAAHTRRLLPAPRSTTERRGATNTKDEALLLRSRQLGSDDSSEAPDGSATRRAVGAALLLAGWISQIAMTRCILLLDSSSLAALSYITAMYSTSLTYILKILLIT
jgi:hypothetical protein